MRQVRQILNDRMFNDYGLKMHPVEIENIVTDRSDHKLGNNGFI